MIDQYTIKPTPAELSWGDRFKKMDLVEDLSEKCDNNAKWLLENSAYLLHHKTTSEMSSRRHVVYNQYYKINKIKGL